MHTLERFARSLRHSRGLRNAEWLWNRLRPSYTALLATLAQNGLERVINGTDVIRLMPDYRFMAENYEPAVWKRVMEEARIGDVAVDVGANIGLYAIALAKRVGTGGKVHAFEPDPANFKSLDRHCSLNGVTRQVVLYQAAVAQEDGRVPFERGRGSESRISSGATAFHIDCVCLDSVFADGRVDILKIDVEGFEEAVLRGASQLLSEPTRGPRFIYLEVHPYAWRDMGTKSESLLTLLAECGYVVEDSSGQPVKQIEAYGGVCARRPHR
jgi:FkbM family methyltransferase